MRLWGCSGADDQKWKPNADGAISGVQSGLGLDVTDRGTANASPVQLRTCHGGSNQRWTRPGPALANSSTTSRSRTTSTTPSRT
nr:RICIN domain-containing protein [Kitasatospora phosalacinea]